MKQLWFMAAVAVILIAAAVWWVRTNLGKPAGLPYTMGKAVGPETGFMDTSVARGGVTPIKGNLGLIAKADYTTNAWFGDSVAAVSSMPTSNPVRVQTKTIW